MTPIITLNDEDVFPNAVPAEVASWTDRSTVKIILQNEKGEIALVTNPSHGCFLLPGGGMDEGETLTAAADRECREETGFSIKDIVEIGFSEEFRARDAKHYVTAGVFATTDCATGEDARTDGEKAVGLHVIWRPLQEVYELFAEQRQRLTEGKIGFYNTGFNILRDQAFVDEAVKKGIPSSL